jgi:hypothetical protein
LGIVGSLHRWIVASLVRSFVLRRSPFVIYSLVDVTLIDWFSVLSATLWISGLAFLLALFGLARAARERSTRQSVGATAFSRRDDAWHCAVCVGDGACPLRRGSNASVGVW